MKIQVKDLHPDVTRYLENDCYCQYEVYDWSGFFFILVEPEADCVLIGENSDIITAAVTTTKGNDYLVHFYLEDDKVVDAGYMPLCEENIECAKNYFKTLKPQKFIHDTKNVKELLSMSDFIIAD